MLSPAPYLIGASEVRGMDFKPLAPAAFKRDGLKSFGFSCVRDLMSHRSRLTAGDGDCLRRQAGRLAGLRPPPAPAPILRKGVNVLLARTEEIQKVHAHVFAGLADAQKNQVFLQALFSGTPAITSRSCANALMACSALLLCQGTPSWLRKVKSLSRFRSNRSLHFVAASLR